MTPKGSSSDVLVYESHEVNSSRRRSSSRTMTRTLRAAPSGPRIEHPPSVRRRAPAIQRLQRTDSAASKLALRPPLIRGPVKLQAGHLLIGDGQTATTYRKM